MPELELDNLNFPANKSWFCVSKESTTIENCWILTIFGVKIQILTDIKYHNHNIFGTKIQIHNFVIFPKIEFLNTIWDVQTVCRPCVYCNLFPLLSLVLSWGSQSSPGTIVIKLLFWGMQHHLLRDLFSFFPSFPHKSLVGLVLYPRNSSNIFYLFLCMLSFRSENGHVEFP